MKLRMGIPLFFQAPPFNLISHWGSHYFFSKVHLQTTFMVTKRLTCLFSNLTFASLITE